MSKNLQSNETGTAYTDIQRDMERVYVKRIDCVRREKLRGKKNYLFLVHGRRYCKLPFVSLSRR